MATAMAVTNEQGLMYNGKYRIGYSGHGGNFIRKRLNFSKKQYRGQYPIINVYALQLKNPEAYKEMLKIVDPTHKVFSHEVAYTEKTNSKGKKYHSNLGQYITIKVGKDKLSTLIKTHMCMFFINSEKVTDFNAYKAKASK